VIRRRRPLDPRVRGAAGDESADDDAHATFLKLFLRLTTRTGEREEKRLNPVGEVRVRVFLKVQWGVSSLFCNTRREFASSFRVIRRWVRASAAPSSFSSQNSFPR
jgi:hypothetical protein